MKLGTWIRLSDGREGTVVFNSLIGIGIVWGLHILDPADFLATDGNTMNAERPPNWQWEPDAILRDPWPNCERAGFLPTQCVGSDYEILKNDEPLE